MIEGVIVDTIGAIISLYNEDFQYYKDYKPIKYHEVNSWNFTELNCATPEYINTYFNQQRFFDRLDFMYFAKEALDRLSKIYNIVIVSMGYSPNLRGKELWIKKHMPYAEFIGVNFKEHPNKAHVPMYDGVAFVDDSANNLETSNCKNLICFGDIYPWSENWNGTRCFNWYELERCLMNLQV